MLLEQIHVFDRPAVKNQSSQSDAGREGRADALFTEQCRLHRSTSHLLLLPQSETPSIFVCCVFLRPSLFQNPMFEI